MARLLFFGALQDAAGIRERDVALPAHVRTVDDLRAWLAAEDPALGARLAAPGVRCAIDRAFAQNNAALAGAEEIAFMSPLSGG